MQTLWHHRRMVWREPKSGVLIMIADRFRQFADMAIAAVVTITATSMLFAATTVQSFPIA
jgi:hypothetical protein